MQRQRPGSIHTAAVFFLLLLTGLMISGCHKPSEKPGGTCSACHDLQLDTNHQLACTSCHNGDDTIKEKEEAHHGLNPTPAHPDNFDTGCGKCHPENASHLRQAGHYTIANLSNLVRAAFGNNGQVANLTEIPEHEDVTNPGELADDLLRRRCLRCHLFSAGDDYPAVTHGTGCAACHLAYTNGSLTSHAFAGKPDQKRCLSCHYGNRVGFDYFGFTEHDFNQEYRTPHLSDSEEDRPYGVEYHQLAPDIHQRKGLVCLDCHNGQRLMGNPEADPDPRCESCHNPVDIALHPPEFVTKENGEDYTFTSPVSGKKHPLPLMQHPAHEKYSDSVGCQVCHGQWSFQDYQTNLLRNDEDEYADWSRLFIQGSSEVESLLRHNLDYDKEELPPRMTDAITGEARTGVWYKGYLMRRWEQLLTGRDSEGKLVIVRPILDLTLSYVDADGITIIDAHKSTADSDGYRPYTPHTTGPAGKFWEQRLREELRKNPLSAFMLR